MTQYRGFRDLRVYSISYKVAKRIFEISKSFPIEERYSLTDQVRRSSRSVAANLAEAWRKRKYERLFVSKIIEASGEASETEVWLDMAVDYGYLSEATHKELLAEYDRLQAMLNSMMNRPEKFCH
jgi:four helix bundle protein